MFYYELSTEFTVELYERTVKWTWTGGAKQNKTEKKNPQQRGLVLTQEPQKRRWWRGLVLVVISGIGGG